MDEMKYNVIGKKSNSEFQQGANLAPMLEKTTMQILRKNGVLTGNKVFGMIEEVLNKTTLRVYIDQATTSEIVSCSPHVKYTYGDRVLIEYINNNPHDMFVLGTIAGGYDIDIIDYDSLPDEPVEIIYDSSGKAVEFIYGYDKPETTWRQELERNEKGQVRNVYHYYPDGFVMARTLIRRDSDDKVVKYE